MGNEPHFSHRARQTDSRSSWRPERERESLKVYSGSTAKKEEEEDKSENWAVNPEKGEERREKSAQIEYIPQIHWLGFGFPGPALTWKFVTHTNRWFQRSYGELTSKKKCVFVSSRQPCEVTFVCFPVAVCYSGEAFFCPLPVLALLRLCL